MKILVINAGSSSIKYQLINMEDRTALAKGNVARIGMSGAVLTHKPYDRPEVKVSGEILDHIMAIEYVIAILLSENHGVIKDKTEIGAVGHRFVHGGEYFENSILIDEEKMVQLRKCIDLAPLHNPHNLRGINACQKILEGVPQVAVFDTAMHLKMPPKAYMYGLPYKLYKRYSIRRYGFHGTSHYYVSLRAADMLGKPREELKIITAHLGNGASIAAIDKGVSVDTSMGFTPLEGLLMGTRCGDVDPAIILHVMAREELSLHEANTLLNKHSGLLGISGLSSDMKDLMEDADSGGKKAALAIEVYCYRLMKYIAGYTGVMSGCDALVFTGGIGENAPLIRKKSTENLEFMGLKIDDNKNNASIRVEADISAGDATIKSMVIPTNEELVIATDTYELINSGAKQA
ncbi:MAG: acetate/propionate family kinase [candidate division Zixibacteria bacterium]|nr:acetate/propionate family kinase [candidate division Zixibacteria bacterium]